MAAKLGSMTGVYQLRPKIFLFFLAGLMISFAWPLRGQFGHVNGALIPGAFAAFIVCALVSSQNWKQAFAQAVIFGGLGFGIGGEFGYGSLVDSIIAAPSLKDVIPQLIHVFFIGAIWGGLGMTFLGFGMAELKILLNDLAVLIPAGAGSWLAVKLGAPDVYTFLASFSLLHIYNSVFKKSNMVSLFAFYGFWGFGLGFLISVLILWAGSHGYLPGSWWSLRDQIWGFIGGLSVLLATNQAVRRGLSPEPLSSPLVQRAGFIFYTVFITGINVWNVTQKWFFSTPPVENPLGPAIYIAVCFLILLILAAYFLKVKYEVFSGNLLNRTLTWTTLFYAWFLSILAISKSIVYSGWSAWEKAFALFLIDSLILSFTLPVLLLGKNSLARN